MGCIQNIGVAEIDSSSSSGPCPVLDRRYLLMAFKGTAEYTLTGKPGVKTNVLYWQTGVFQQISGGGNAGVDQIFVGSIAGHFFKCADKMIGTQVHPGRQCINGKIFGEMFIDVGDRILCHAIMMAGLLLVRHMKQKFSQNIIEVF